jgi:hypothetical protein
VDLLKQVQEEPEGAKTRPKKIKVDNPLRKGRIAHEKTLKE